MRQISGVVLFILLCSVLASCKKDMSDTAPRLVNTVTIDGNACTISYLYDGQNRLSSITQCDTAETYTYYTDSVVYVRMNSGVTAYKYVYMMGNSGLATGYTKIASDGSVTNYIFSYDAAKNHIKTTDITHPNTFVNYTVQNNNTVYDSSVSSLISSGNYTISRTFYANTENTINNVNYGKGFLGNASANFKKTETFNTPDGIYTAEYIYTLDYLNGVQKRVTQVNGITTETRYYQYN